MFCKIAKIPGIFDKKENAKHFENFGYKELLELLSEIFVRQIMIAVDLDVRGPYVRATCWVVQLPFHVFENILKIPDYFNLRAYFIPRWFISEIRCIYCRNFGLKPFGSHMYGYCRKCIIMIKTFICFQILGYGKRCIIMIKTFICFQILGHGRRCMVKNKVSLHMFFQRSKSTQWAWFFYCVCRNGHCAHGMQACFYPSPSCFKNLSNNNKIHIRPQIFRDPWEICVAPWPGKDFKVGSLHSLCRGSVLRRNWWWVVLVKTT